MYESLPTTFTELPAFASFVLLSLAVFLVGHFLGRPLARAVLRRLGVSDPVRDAVEDSYTTVLAFAAVVFALSATDLDPMPTTSGAVLAAATLSAGIGAREVLKNLVSGLFIVNNEDIDVGAWIEWGGHTGVVEAISLRVTKIRTFDDETVVVPNSKLTDDVVVTPASSGKLRLRYPFGIGYDDDIETAIRYIVEEASSIEGVASDPEPRVRVTELGTSAVELDARVWLDGCPVHGEAVRVRSELIKRVKQRFQSEGISMPGPLRTLDGSIDVSMADESA